MTPHARPATPDDVAYMAPRLRNADLDEIAAASGRDVTPVLQEGLAISDPCRVGVDTEGVPVVLYGCSPVSSMTGAIWMVATDGLANVSRPFIRQSRREVEALNAQYPLLFNYVDARNELHHRWLRWCGFTFIAKHEHHGVAGIPFYEFVRIPKCAIQ